MKFESIKYPQVPYSRDAGGPVTGEPEGFYLGRGKVRKNGDAALTGDPLVTFKGFRPGKVFRREPDLIRRAADAYL